MSFTWKTEVSNHSNTAKYFLKPKLSIYHVIGLLSNRTHSSLLFVHQNKEQYISEKDYIIQKSMNHIERNPNSNSKNVEWLRKTIKKMEKQIEKLRNRNSGSDHHQEIKQEKLKNSNISNKLGIYTYNKVFEYFVILKDAPGWVRTNDLGE